MPLTKVTDVNRTELVGNTFESWNNSHYENNSPLSDAIDSMNYALLIALQIAPREEISYGAIFVLVRVPPWLSRVCPMVVPGGVRSVTRYDI